MKTLHFSPEEMLTFDQILATIVHLGNVKFVFQPQTESISIEGKSGKSTIATLARLLQVDSGQLERTLCGRTITANREVMRKDHNVQQAEAGRDAFAKAIYERLFDKVVSVVNRALKVEPKGYHGQQRQCAVIGVLDIYGFEVLECNSFEQFCINYCNERLQQLFISLVLRQEQEEYAREGIEWSHIEYFDNMAICSLVDNNKTGMFATFDDSCLAVGRIDDKLLLETMDKRYKSDQFYDSRRKSPAEKSLRHDRNFLIKHYAGPVTYDIEGFIEKNRDTLFQDFKRLLYSSKNRVISGIWLYSFSPWLIAIFFYRDVARRLQKHQGSEQTSGDRWPSIQNLHE